jgi:Arc/MetJ-type ribon-helix-helix transcriptional regulator
LAGKEPFVVAVRCPVAVVVEFHELGRAMASRRSKAQPPAKQVDVRMPPKQLKALDAWIRTHPVPRPSRPEAIRRLVEQALAGAVPHRRRSKKSASAAREMASRAIDRLSDTSLDANERERRKHRLTKGPREFRDVRGDLPKPKW